MNEVVVVFGVRVHARVSNGGLSDCKSSGLEMIPRSIELLGALPWRYIHIDNVLMRVVENLKDVADLVKRSEMLNSTERGW